MDLTLRAGVFTAVFGWFGEAAGAGAVVCSRYVVAGDDKGPAMQMITLSDSTVCGLGVHVCELGFHFRAGEHADVFDAEGLEDVFLEVVV